MRSSLFDSFPSRPVALTVAGSDSGGGAGIQADLKAFEARGVFGTSAITCLTAQNPDEVSGLFPIDAEFVVAQMERVLAYFDVRAIKTGMLLNAEIVESVVAFLRRHDGLPVVVDPVMVASSGAELLEDEAIDFVRKYLLPQATLVTPNLDEVGLLLEQRPNTVPEMVEAAQELVGRYGTAVLIKGGHLMSNEISDVLVLPGEEPRFFESTRVPGISTHGSGCTLAAAIAAEMARGSNLVEAVRHGHAYLQLSLRDSIRLGEERFINHSAVIA